MAIAGENPSFRVRGEIAEPNEGDFWLETGYVLEKLVSGKTFVSNICETPDGGLYMLEAGFSYPYVFTEARLSRVLSNGDTETVIEGLNGPAVGIVWHEGAFLVTHRGVLSRITPDGQREDLIMGLPALGDHHTNHMALVDGLLYFGQGSATNAGVVGVDNLIPFGWLKDYRDFSDMPAFDVTLAGVNYETRDAFNPLHKVETGAYLPFGNPSSRGQVVPGVSKPTSVIYRCNPDGSELAVFASGFRNPYSVAVSPDGRLFCLDQGGDDRGSRPLHTLDTIWEVKEGGWYGFPDFLGGRPVPELVEEQDAEGSREFLLAEHPQREMPYAQVPELHAAAVQMQFSASEAFGFLGHAFLAEYGSGAPLTTGGKLERSPQGVRRFDPQTREFHDFYRNENPGFGGHGPERPTAVRFSADGGEMYIADYGKFGTPKTGAVWRIRRG